MDKDVIMVKDKVTEKVIFQFNHPLQIDMLLELLKKDEKEVIVIEDENHNVVKSKEIRGPAIIYESKFIPQRKKHKKILHIEVVPPKGTFISKKRKKSIAI